MRQSWFARCRKGQALMEYVLLIALVATCLVAILGLTRKAANDAYTRTADQLGPMHQAGFGSSGGSWRPSGSGSGKPTPADPDSTGGSADAGGGAGSDAPVSAFSTGAR